MERDETDKKWSQESNLELIGETFHMAGAIVDTTRHMNKPYEQ
jgi:hypothetical protein